MNNLTQTIESLLLVEPKGFSLKRLAGLTQASADEVSEAVAALAQRYTEIQSGLRLVQDGNQVQLTTGPESAVTIQAYVKDETSGELTRPSLETLTIIAYRGPIPKSELELIRGINCSLILRNLLIRGLVREEAQKTTGESIYSVTVDFLRLLGLSSTAELPEFEKLNQNVDLQTLLGESEQEKDFFLAGKHQSKPE
ncbi:MAG: SMC-Scp complex subunit ScpB [Patescibacteria group bacterium]